MKIPNPKPLGISHDSWTREGSKSKNSLRFLDNYDDVFKNRKPIKGHVTIVYKNGKRYELHNPSTHGEQGQREWDEFNRETGGIRKHKDKPLHEI